MILGELPVFKKLLPQKTETEPRKTLLTKRIDLNKLEVVECFHLSPVSNRKSIPTYGLLPKGTPEGWHGSEIISYEPRIFLSVVEDEIAFPHVGFENVDVWVFYLPKQVLFPDEHSEYANHYYTKQRIPWYKLKLIEF